MNQIVRFTQQYILYLSFSQKSRMGCANEKLENPSKYQDQQIVRSLKSQRYEDFVQSIKNYAEYLASKKYNDLINSMCLKISSALSKINEKKQPQQKVRKNEQNDVRKQFSNILELSCENISILCLQIDEINKILAKEKRQSNQKEIKLKQQWSSTIGLLMSTERQIKSAIQYDSNPKKPITKSQSEDQMKGLSSNLKIQDNLKRIADISEIPPEQINQKQKNGVFETEKNAIIMKLQKQIQRVQQKHKQQISRLKQEIIRNNIKSNQALKEINSENNSNLQSYRNQIEKLRRNIDLLQNQIEEKNTKISDFQNRMKCFLENEQLQAPQEPQFALTNSLEKKNRKIKNIATFDSFVSSQIYEKFLNSRILCTQTKQGRVYRDKIDTIFHPIIIQCSKQIFSFDSRNPNNMNDYINEEKDLVFVAKLQNGVIVGGFSRSGFKQVQDSMANNLCFIFSLHPDDTYYKCQLKNESLSMHSVRLDSSFLKFGTNELRISCGKTEGICTVSSPSCIFQQKNIKQKISLKEFIGSENSKLNIKHYEVYKLYLQYPTPVAQEQKKVDPFFSTISTF